jgi:hypothetical protein
MARICYTPFHINNGYGEQEWLTPSLPQKVPQQVHYRLRGI